MARSVNPKTNFSSKFFLGDRISFISGIFGGFTAFSIASIIMGISKNSSLALYFILVVMFAFVVTPKIERSFRQVTNQKDTNLNKVCYPYLKNTKKKT